MVPITPCDEVTSNALIVVFAPVVNSRFRRIDLFHGCDFGIKLNHNLTVITGFDQILQHFLLSVDSYYPSVGKPIKGHPTPFTIKAENHAFMRKSLTIK